MHSSYQGFHNINVYTGSFDISGTAVANTNTATATVQLESTPNFSDVIFNGPPVTGSGRPTDAYFKEGVVQVLGNNVPAGYSNYPTLWTLNSSVSGSTVIITATYVQTFNDPLTLVSTPVYYRIVDYTVF